MGEKLHLGIGHYGIGYQDGVNTVISRNVRALREIDPDLKKTARAQTRMCVRAQGSTTLSACRCPVHSSHSASIYIQRKERSFITVFSVRI